MYHYSAPFFSENQQVMNFCSLAVGLKLAAEASRSDITDRLTFCDGVEQFFAGRAELGTDGALRRLSSLVPVSSISEYTFPELENG